MFMDGGSRMNKTQNSNISGSTPATFLLLQEAERRQRPDDGDMRVKSEGSALRSNSSLFIKLSK